MRNSDTKRTKTSYCVQAYFRYPLASVWKGVIMNNSGSRKLRYIKALLYRYSSRDCQSLSDIVAYRYRLSYYSRREANSARNWQNSAPTHRFRLLLSLLSRVTRSPFGVSRSRGSGSGSPNGSGKDVSASPPLLSRERYIVGLISRTHARPRMKITRSHVWCRVDEAPPPSGASSVPSILAL